ncbi:hypothetical protein, partial [Enterocloster clostridioformis]
IKVLCCRLVQQQLLYLITVARVCQQLFSFFLSYSLALLVLTAAQEISYQMLQQMSTDIFNFFHFLRFSISRPSQSL